MMIKVNDFSKANSPTQVNISSKFNKFDNNDLLIKDNLNT